MKPMYRLIGYEAGYGRVLRVSVVDQAGYENDRLEFDVDDAEGTAFIPPRGTPITPVIGYDLSTQGDGYYNGVHRMGGMFLVDEIQFSGFPRTVKITAHASDMASTAKERKERSWHDTTVGDIVRTIAQEQEWTARIDSELLNIAVEHRDQVNQSNVGFLTDIAKELDAMFKVTFNNCYMGRRSIPLNTVTVPMDSLLSYSGLSQTKSSYTGVKARWHNYTTGENTTEIVREAEDVDRGTAGTADNLFTLTHVYPSQGEALDAANSKMASLRRENETFRFTCVGNPRLMAESLVVLMGPRPGLRTEWVLDRVTHRFDESGYVTECDCIAPNKLS